MKTQKRILGFDVARVIAMFYIVGIVHLSEYTNMSIIQYAACESLVRSTLGVFTFLSAFLLGTRYTFF